MKIKKLIIIILFIIILINILNIMTINVYATSAFDKIIEDAKDFTEDEVTSTTTPITITVDKLQNTSKIISSILFVLAIGVAIVTTAVLGVNLMIQSAEEKAKTKEALVPLVIGMFVSFGAYGLWTTMVRIFSEL